MTRILLVLALAACGGGTQRAPEPQVPARPPTKTVEHTPEPARPPTEDECRLLLRHAIQVSLKERPADQQLSREEQDQLLVGMHCQGVTRDIYDCAMAATTTTTMATCDQRTPSSSTSKSSVAPGGMTPPAPRAP